MPGLSIAAFAKSSWELPSRNSGVEGHDCSDHCGQALGPRTQLSRMFYTSRIPREAIRRMPETGFVPVFVATLLSVNYSLSGAIMLLPWAFPGEMRKAWPATQEEVLHAELQRGITRKRLVMSRR